MNQLALFAFLSAMALMLSFSQAASAADDDGFKSIFDGKTLEGWSGNAKFWRVEDGAITGETTEENPTPGNTFLIWQGGQPGDFELRERLSGRHGLGKRIHRRVLRREFPRHVGQSWREDRHRQES
jgi:hypothetical protein